MLTQKMITVANRLCATFCLSFFLIFCSSAHSANDDDIVAEDLIFIGDFEGALAQIRMVAGSRDPLSPQANVLIGRLLLAIGNFESAAGFFSNLSEHETYGPSATNGLAQSALGQGQLLRARRYAERSLEKDPDNIGAQLTLLRIDVLTGRISNAENRLVELLRDAPANTHVARVRGELINRSHGANNMVAFFREFAGKNSESPKAQVLLAKALADNGSRSDAAGHWKRTAELFSEQGNQKAAKFSRQQASLVLRPDQPAKSKPLPSPKPQATVRIPDVQTPPKTEEPAKKPLAISPSPPWTTRGGYAPLPFPHGTSITTGSGFILDGDRLVITNRHVIENAEDLVIRNGAGHLRKARVVKISSADDLALLEASSPFPSNSGLSIADPATAVRPGRAVAVVGYPLSAVLGDQFPSITEGIISKLNGLNNDPFSFQFTAKLNKGNSGGPILDKMGRVVGVAVAKLDTIKFYKSQGYLPEDINLGIKVDRLAGFITKEIKTVAIRQRESSLEELYEAALSGVVLVAGRKKK